MARRRPAHERANSRRSRLASHIRKAAGRLFRALYHAGVDRRPAPLGVRQGELGLSPDEPLAFVLVRTHSAITLGSRGVRGAQRICASTASCALRMSRGTPRTPILSRRLRKTSRANRAAWDARYVVPAHHVKRLDQAPRLHDQGGPRPCRATCESRIGQI
jgi:hypothetical protein